MEYATDLLLGLAVLVACSALFALALSLGYVISH